MPSRLAIQTKDISIPRAESSPVTATRNKGASFLPVPCVCLAYGFSVSAPPRTSSAATVTQVKSGREPSPREALSARTQRQGSGVRGSSNTGRDQGAGAPPRESPVLEEDSLTSSSEEESDSEEDVSSRRAPGFKRFGKFSIHRAGLRDDEEDDDDDSPAFLPLPRGAEPGSREAHRSDLNATLRLEHQHPGAQRRETTEHVPLTKQTTMMSSASSASSGVAVGMPQESRRPSSYALGALSPQRAAHLSPRRRAAAGNDASDTPSMGSSFSDLDGRFLIIDSPILHSDNMWILTSHV